ncbi:hypothetical protein K0M31_004745, partial [Melipona bicolor]
MAVIVGTSGRGVHRRKRRRRGGRKSSEIANPQANGSSLCESSELSAGLSSPYIDSLTSGPPGCSTGTKELEIAFHLLDLYPIPRRMTSKRRRSRDLRRSWKFAEIRNLRG